MDFILYLCLYTYILFVFGISTPQYHTNTQNLLLPVQFMKSNVILCENISERYFALYQNITVGCNKDRTNLAPFFPQKEAPRFLFNMYRARFVINVAISKSWGETFCTAGCWSNYATGIWEWLPEYQALMNILNEPRAKS